MACTRILAGVVALALLTRPVSGAALPPDWKRPALIRVSVAARPPAPSSRRQLLQMMQETEAIWQPYGVVLIWAAPWAAGSAAPADISLDVEFVPYARLTIDSARKPDARASTLGVIRFFDGDRPEGVLKLSAGDVESIVLATRWTGAPPDHLPPALLEEMTGRALGRVLAHELGHYLLAQRAHTATGLMRPLYPGSELAGWDRQGFRLDACSVDRLHARVGGLIAAPIGARAPSERPCH